MTRTTAREIAIQITFGLSKEGADPGEAIASFFEEEHFASLAQEDELFSEYPDKRYMDYIKRVVTGTQEHRSELDDIIENYSKGWKLSRISRIAAAILRTALFEVIYMDDVPDSVAINEAVEISKGYEEKETISFINGILGSFMRAERGLETEEIHIDSTDSDTSFNGETPGVEE